MVGLGGSHTKLDEPCMNMTAMPSTTWCLTAWSARSPARYIHHAIGTAFTAFHIDVLAELPAWTTCARFTTSDTSVGLMVMLTERSDVRQRIRLRSEG